MWSRATALRQRDPERFDFLWLGNADANDFEKKLAQAAKDAFKEEQKHNEQTLGIAQSLSRPWISYLLSLLNHSEQQKQLKSQMSQLGEADMSGILTGTCYEVLFYRYGFFWYEIADSNWWLLGSQVGAIVNIGASDIGSANASYQQEISSQKLQFETNINQGRCETINERELLMLLFWR
jgi:hypothetical protein